MIYKGNPVSAGIAIGSAFVYDPKILTAPEDAPVLPMECELERYENAVQAAQAKLREIQAAFTGKDDDKAEIFSAHLDMVDDEEISEEIRSAIHAGTGAAKAVEQVYQRYADLLAALDDDFMVQRAHDLLDVQQRLLRILLGALEQNLSRLDGPVIVICDDLMPSDTATMDRANVLGIVAQKGGYTSHSAIIARGWGIPAVLGIPDIMSCVSSGDTIVLDAIAGNLHSEPTPQELQNAAAQQTMFMEQKSISDKFLYAPGRTLDGVPVEIGLNMGKPAPEVLETSTATDYVGLLRTEFLYMESDHMPTEEEQFAAYKKVLLEYGERPVTLRTLDIGGDKSLPYFALPREDNPFLGIRALRLCFENEDIMRTQLRAALRASVYGTLWLMFPMVSGLEDFTKARIIVLEEKERLWQSGVAVSDHIKLGVMIETPAAVMMADQLAKQVDFASIGSNDLCQYLTAADRMNPAVAQYCRSSHPAIYRAIAMTIQAFRKENKPLSICGELGGDKNAACVLVGMGMRKLSMSIHAVPGVKQMPIIYLNKKEVVLDLETVNNIVKHPKDYSLYVELETVQKAEYVHALETLFSDYSEYCREVDKKNRLAKISCMMQSWYRSLPQTSKTFEDPDRDDQDIKSIIAFRKLFTDIYLNPREIIFERLPKIFKSTATTDTIAAVQVVKNEIDSHIHFVRATAIKIIRDTFGFAEETNLQQSLLTWYDNLPEVAKNSIFSARVSSLIEYIQAVDTGDTDDIASKIVRKTTGMFIEDWKSGFESKFKDELKEAVDEVLSKKENAVDTSQKILLMSDDGTSVERFYDFDAENLSATATFFRNALEDVMEEYDGILENNEKIGVLMDAIKKLMT